MIGEGETKPKAQPRCPRCGNLMRMGHDGAGMVAVCWSGCVTLYDWVSQPVADDVKDTQLHGPHDIDRPVVSQDHKPYKHTTIYGLEDVLAKPDVAYPHVEFLVAIHLWHHPTLHNNFNCGVEPPPVIHLPGRVEAHIAKSWTKNARGLSRVNVDAITVPFSLETVKERGARMILQTFLEAIRRVAQRDVSIPQGQGTRDFPVRDFAVLTWAFDAPPLPRWE